MSGGMDTVPLFTPEELEAVAAAVEEMRMEADIYCEWLRSPEGQAWTDQQIREGRAMVEEFEAEIAAGKYSLSADELEQLRWEGIFVSHRKKERSVHD